MKNERAPESVAVFAYGRRSTYAAGFSPIVVTAALSVLVLLIAFGWEMTRTTGAENSPQPTADGHTSLIGTPAAPDATASADSAATSSDPIASLGSVIVENLEGAYLQMQQSGTYSTSSAQQAGESLAPYVNLTVPYTTFSPTQIKTDSDTSYARMLRYRSDLRASLSPLLNNTQPEYELFAYYVDTHDAGYLVKLQRVSANYRAAASSTALVVAPQDAASVHVGMLNAMEEFAATLDAMVAHAQDPYASAALLQNYNQAESDMLTAFNALADYGKGKLP